MSAPAAYRRKLGSSPDFAKEPHCLYLFYFGIKKNAPYIRHYYYYGTDARMDLVAAESKAIELTLNARLDDANQEPQPVDAEWERKSWLVIVVDIDGYVFEPGNGIEFSPDHSFSDAVDRQIQIAPGESRAAIFLINHLKRNRSGSDLNAGSQDFVFKLKPPLERPSRDETGGTNLGPPVPPPA